MKRLCSMLNLKKVAGVLLSVATIASLSACSSQSSTTYGQASKTLKSSMNVAIDSDPGNLGPLGSTAAAYVADNIYESFFAYGYNMKITPQLATKWDEKSSTDYVFFLRKGAVDSNGNAFTAKDALFSLKLMASDPVQVQDVKYVDFKKTKVINKTTLEVVFSQQNAFNFSSLASVQMVTEAAYKASKDKMATDPVGTGPYKLTNLVSGSTLTLKANSKWWGSAPSIKTVTLNVITEATQRTTALTTGQDDIITALQNSDTRYVKNTKGYSVINQAGTMSATVFFNMDKSSPCTSKDLRQAIAYSISNKDILDAVYNRSGVTDTCAFSPSMSDYTKNMTYKIETTQDIATAKKLFKKSGVSASKKIRIITDGTDQQVATAEILQAELAKTGITAQINNYDNASLWKVFGDKSAWDVLLMNASAPSAHGLDEINAFLCGLNNGKWSGTAFNNFKGYCNTALSAASDKQRLAYTEKATALIADECPMYAICSIYTNYGYNSSINMRIWNQNCLYYANMKFAG